MSEQFSGRTTWTAVRRIPFSSSTKWSGADFGENGRYVVGASEFIMGAYYDTIRENAEPWSARGCRVLLLAGYEKPLEPSLDCSAVTPIALIYLNNLVRPDAPDTFKYFAQQGVRVCVISGDNPVTVSEVAARACIEHADRYVDATTLQSDKDFDDAVQRYTVFGRVTPEQKRKLVHAFQQAGHIVAMTGDGVNDVLALKDANCGIAMASGSQAASQVAQIVLTDSNFAALPDVVAEGRRVINNIERSASLYFVKNIFSVAMAVISLIFTLPYPLSPAQLGLVNCMTIGIPAFFLAMEPNRSLVQGKFLKNVVRRALPAALTDILLVGGVMLFYLAADLPDTAMSTICAGVMGVVGLMMVHRTAKPYNKLRLAMICLLALGFVGSFLFLKALFNLVTLEFLSALVLAVFALLAWPVMNAVYKLGDKIAALAQRRKKTKTED